MSRAEATPLEQLLALPLEERRLGPFVLDRQLGRGGFAPVWLAREIHGETCLRSAALKLFNVEREADRFAAVIEEARVLASVVHPNVVHFYQLVLDEGRGVAGLAMELVSGESVARQLAQRKRLPVDEVVRVGVAVASALSAVHRAGLVHRDVKPENVVAAGGTYKLIDFGIAAASRPAPEPRARRVLLDELPVEMAGASLSETPGAFTRDADDPEGPTLLQDVQGTIGYMDPATVALGLPESVASDLYGLGVLLFECVTGRLPAVVAAGARGGMDGAVLDGRKRAPGLRGVEPSVPEALASLVDALLEPEPSRRPASEWVQAELERIERAIREGLSQALPPEEEGPFRGLAGYHEADAGVFFQREGETAAVIELLRRSGLVVIQGRMGSGKSSLVRAGVIPAVRRGALEPLIKRWVVASCLVGRDLRGAVVRALGPVIPDAHRLTAAELVAALAEHVKATGTGVLLALDQLEDLVALASFEELAKLVDAASGNFAVDLLQALASAPAGLRCLATLRRDFRPVLDELPGIKPILTRTVFVLNPLGRSAWTEVISRGLQAYSYRVDGALGCMLNEAFDERDMVQRGFVLATLWRERDVSKRELPAYDRSRELGYWAEECTRNLVRKLGDGANEAIRRLLLSLLTSDGTRASRHVDEVHALGDLPMMDEIVSVLTRAGLIICDGEEVFLAHDVLISSWVVLGDWFRAALDDRKVREDFELAAMLYARSQDPSILRVWSGARLDDVLGLLAQEGIRLSVTAERFIGQIASFEESGSESRTTRRSPAARAQPEVSHPSTDHVACLVVVYSRDLRDLGKKFDLDGSSVGIGRSMDNVIVLEGDSVSRRHARCHRTRIGWSLRDLGSSNGTYVNDELIPQDGCDLLSGDRVKVGSTILKYLAGPRLEIERLCAEEIGPMTTLDGLTQARNARYLVDALRREIIRARTRETPLGLVMFDIDRLRRIDEEHGSLAGEGVLREVVKAVLLLLSSYHVLARYGDDDFIVLCPDSPPDVTGSLAESLRDAIASRPFTFQGELLRVTASFGVAQLRPEVTSAEELIREAQQKLREAKDAGRNCVRA